MKPMKHSHKAGFTLVEIMIVVGIIGLLAAIAIPNFVRARMTAQTNACIYNLSHIDGAKQQWALEDGKAVTATPSESAIESYIGHSGTIMPVCPLNGGAASPAYIINPVSLAPVCPHYNTNSHPAMITN